MIEHIFPRDRGFDVTENHVGLWIYPRDSLDVQTMFGGKEKEPSLVITSEGQQWISEFPPEHQLSIITHITKGTYFRLSNRQKHGGDAYVTPISDATSAYAHLTKKRTFELMERKYIQSPVRINPQPWESLELFQILKPVFTKHDFRILMPLFATPRAVIVPRIYGPTALEYWPRGAHRSDDFTDVTLSSHALSRDVANALMTYGESRGLENITIGKGKRSLRINIFAQSGRIFFYNKITRHVICLNHDIMVDPTNRFYAHHASNWIVDNKPSLWRLLRSDESFADLLRHGMVCVDPISVGDIGVQEFT